MIRNLDGLLTFVPNPIPSILPLSSGIIRRVAEVSNLLGRLDGTARTLPDPGILIRSFVRREAQLSSYIENTFARYDEIAEADANLGANVSEQVRETANAERTIISGVEQVQ